MIYVALLRARRTLIWSAIVLAVIVAVVDVSFFTNHVSMQMDHDPGRLPDSAFIGAALAVALVIACITATSLNREAPTLPIAWTKPVARRRIALEYFAVDLATVVAVALLALVAALGIAVPIDALRHVVHDPKLAEVVGRSLGIIFMWYAVVQAATAGLPGRGGIVAGLSWPVFGGLIGLAFWNVPFLHWLVLALNVINPLAWMSSESRAEHGVVVSTVSSLYPFLPYPAVVVAPWLLGALALYLATVLWSRREA